MTDFIFDLEAFSSDALLRYSEPKPETLAEIERLLDSYCCGIYAPEDDPPIPEPQP